MQGQLNMHEVMQMLELPMSEVEPLLNSLKGNGNDAQSYLTKFKLLVRKQRRYLAKKYHPDVTTENEQHMKQINNMVDYILQSKITSHQPVHVARTYYYTYTTRNYYSGGTSTAASYY